MEELTSGLQGPPGPPGIGRQGRPGPRGQTGPQGSAFCMALILSGFGGFWELHRISRKNFVNISYSRDRRDW